MKTEPVSSCPGCGGTALAGFVFGGAPLQRCASCGLVSATEYGDPAEIYVDGYLSGETPFGIDLTHPLFQRLLEDCARARMELIEAVLAPPARFLDVGCGTGEVLAAARDRGWEVQGVEPVIESARVASEERGLEVRAAMLEESGLPERSYDVVGAFHVLEHMRDGPRFLSLLDRWARPGGYVVVEMPNWRSANRRLLGGGWPHLRPLEHVAYYSPATLERAFRSAGLEPVRIATPTFLWSGQTLEQQLLDLGLARWKRWARPLGRPGSQDGKPALVPNAAGATVLKAVQRAYDRAKVGAVVLGIARVPERLGS